MARSLRTSGHLALLGALTDARKAAGMTQQQLADRMKRPQSFVAKVEGGERRLDVVEFAESTVALGADYGELLAPVLRSVGGEDATASRCSGNATCCVLGTHGRASLVGPPSFRWAARPAMSFPSRSTMRAGPFTTSRAYLLVRPICSFSRLRLSRALRRSSATRAPSSSGSSMTTVTGVSP
ncbi:helix-turn-helix domain-containing protein [Salipiger thiooxidans]|uniref:helix-turn-helix domain-containing protein n=1 Tax=Salipiger thiooxidans TaxID=282683 RepID=UPI000D7BCD7E